MLNLYDVVVRGREGERNVKDNPPGLWHGCLDRVWYISEQDQEWGLRREWGTDDKFSSEPAEFEVLWDIQMGRWVCCSRTQDKRLGFLAPLCEGFKAMWVAEISQGASVESMPSIILPDSAFNIILMGKQKLFFFNVSPGPNWVVKMALTGRIMEPELKPCLCHFTTLQPPEH